MNENDSTRKNIPILEGVPQEYWIAGAGADRLSRNGLELAMTTRTTKPRWWERLLGLKINQYEILVKVTNRGIEIGPIDAQRGAADPGAAIILARDVGDGPTLRLAHITESEAGSCRNGNCSTLLTPKWYLAKTNKGAQNQPLLTPTTRPLETRQYWESRTTAGKNA